MFKLRNLFAYTFALFALVGCLSGQVAVTSQVSGIVTDPSGAVIPNVQIKLSSSQTGISLTASSNEKGEYTVLSVPEGVYKLEATAQGFRTEVVNNVKVDVATPATINVKLEVGTTSDSVVVEAEATQIITNSATVASTITGRQITELPQASRDALDLVLTIPGTNAGGNPRSSTVNMLPKEALNITMDGLNVMDNLLKSTTGGGMYTYIRPRIDAIDEFSMTQGANGADSAGEGAIQIKFVTARGTNAWHGGVYEYFRNTDLNANYWYNNQAGQPRQQLKLNQYGGKVGGPILKNKLFFYANVEEYRLPESNFRQRTVLNTDGVNGIYDYIGTDNQKHSVNVLQLAAANGYSSTPNSLIQSTLKQIDALRGTGVGIIGLNSYEDTMSFNTTDTQKRDFVTTRFDYNITSKLAWSFIYNYDYFYAFPDSLNGYDVPFPGMNTVNGYTPLGGQISNRFSGVTALQWTISPSMTNEFRAGLQGGTANFEASVNPQALPGGLRINFPLGLYDPINRQPSQYRNTPVKQIMDNLSWLKGKHNLTMGFNVSLISYYSQGLSGIYPGVSTGVTGTDPVASIFTASNFPLVNTTTSDLTNAQALYAFLTGRVSSASASTYLNPSTGQFQQQYPFVEHDRQRETGIYIQDNWRVKSNLTFNYGVRWEYQTAPINYNNIYTMPTLGAAGVYSISGVNGLFKPGANGGTPETITAMGDNSFYTAGKKNFAPSVGLAWSPENENKLSKAIFGKGGAFRAGYGIAYVRDGMNVFTALASDNPGYSANSTLTADKDFKAGSIALSNGLPPFTVTPSAYGFPVNMSAFTYTGQQTAWAQPNLATPYVQSWSAGIQREVAKDTVLEVRYVGNHMVKGWRDYNLNEVNIYENGFLNEFVEAQNNYNICSANRTACTGSATGALTFANKGLPGQVNLPIITSAFGSTTSSNFTSSTYTTYLTQGTAGSMANTLSGNSTFMSNLVKAGYPANFFLVNPEVAGSSGAAYILANNSWSNMHSLQIDVRHRFAHNILFDVNYTYGKGLTNYYGDSGTETAGFTTLRNGSLNNVVSPYDIRHQFKMNFIYELPFGPGHALNGNNGFVNRLIGGWQIQGLGLIQSGLPFLLTSGRDTVNQNDAGIVTTMTRDQIQNLIGVYKQPNGNVYFLPTQYIGANGQANTQYFQPASTPGVFGDTNFWLHGLGMVRVNLTLLKNIAITERVKLQFRAEALNAFNNVNFTINSPTASASSTNTSITGTSFARVTQGYQDISTTNDPGGRVIQLVARINF